MAETVMKTVIQVRRDTAANWALHGEVIPAEGEPCLNLDTGEVRYGDGATAYKDLKPSGGVNANHYEGVRQASETDAQVIERVLTAAGKTAEKGDIFIVKALLSAPDKYSYTAYVCNGTAWAAMDGNYNAENVYFDEDLVTTAAVGNITLSNGQATVDAAGKNLKEVWNKIFVKEKNPTVTQPSASVTLTGAGAYEVGTKVTPHYQANFNPGTYQYGGATGVTVSVYEITDTAGNTASTASGDFPEVTVADGTNYKVTAKLTHGAGSVPKTNVGNDYAAGKIAAGSKSATSSAITGYRNSFYGTLTNKNALTSAAIRSLSGKSNKALANGASFTVSIPVGALRVVIAYPATLRDVTSIKDVNGLNAEIKSGFTKTVVSVAGAGSASSIDYKVYTLDYASANDKANSYTVQI